MLIFEKVILKFLMCFNFSKIIITLYTPEQNILPITKEKKCLTLKISQEPTTSLSYYIKMIYTKNKIRTVSNAQIFSS